jgi:hypothetical protein
MHEIAVEPTRSAVQIGPLRTQAVHRAALPSATRSNEGWRKGRLIADERALVAVVRQLLGTPHGEAVAGELSGVGVEVSEVGVEVAGEADGVPT